MSLARCFSNLVSAASSTYFVVVGAAAAIASALLSAKTITTETSEETEAIEGTEPFEETEAPAEMSTKDPAAQTDVVQETEAETGSETETENETESESEVEMTTETETAAENKSETNNDCENESKSESESESDSPASILVVDDGGSPHIMNDDSAHPSIMITLKSSPMMEMHTTTTDETDAEFLRALLFDAEERADALAHLLIRSEARIAILEAHNDDAATDYCAAMDLAHARGKTIARMETKLARVIKHATRLEIELDDANAIAADKVNQVSVLERRVHEMELERQLAVRHEEVVCARPSESEAAGSRSRSRPPPRSHSYLRARGVSSLPESEREREPSAPPSRSNASAQTLVQAKRESIKTTAIHKKKTTKATARGQTGAADAASPSLMAARPRWR